MYAAFFVVKFIISHARSINILSLTLPSYILQQWGFNKPWLKKKGGGVTNNVVHDVKNYSK
jgi:hypothetical protein